MYFDILKEYVVVRQIFLMAARARGQGGSAAVRSEMSPVLAGAARAKADKVVAAAWAARPDAQDGVGGRPDGLARWRAGCRGVQGRL
jgi:hypothetical protein